MQFGAMNKEKIPNFFEPVILVILWTAFLSIAGLKFYNDYRLYSYGRPITATVISVNPKDRNQEVRYSFVVDNITVVGASSPNIRGQGINAIAPGSQLEARYLPQNPRISSLSDPKDLLLLDSAIGSFCLLLLALFTWRQVKGLSKIRQR